MDERIAEALSAMTAPRPMMIGTAIANVILRVIDQLLNKPPEPAEAVAPTGRMVRLKLLISTNLSCPSQQRNLLHSTFPYGYRLARNSIRTCSRLLLERFFASAAIKGEMIT
jgi:hypothetical protein